MDLLLPHLGLIVWTLLAFLIVFFILKKFAWKQIIGGLQERESNIADAIATAEKVKNEMKVLSKYFDFNHEKYVDFYQNLCLLNFHHNDIHIRNIMKDESSNLKLIDFDKSTIME